MEGGKGAGQSLGKGGEKEIPKEFSERQDISLVGCLIKQRAQKVAQQWTESSTSFSVGQVKGDEPGERASIWW